MKMYPRFFPGNNKHMGQAVAYLKEAIDQLAPPPGKFDQAPSSARKQQQRRRTKLENRVLTFVKI